MIFTIAQRRFSENPSNKELWESEEGRRSPLREKFEMVECHNEPVLHKNPPSIKITPKKLLTALPTLSISGPSRSGSPTTPTKEEDEETQNFL